MKEIVFNSVLIHPEDMTFTIVNGTIGTYSLKDVKKITIVGEDAKWKGKSDVFSHTVLTGVEVVSTPLFEPEFYIGLKISMNDGTILALYVSEEAVRMNTDAYQKDNKEAETIKKIIYNKGQVKISKSEKDFNLVKKKSAKFLQLHKDQTNYWFGKTLLFILAIVICGVCVYFHEDIKDWVTIKDRREDLIFYKLEQAYAKIENASYVKVEKEDIFIEKNKEDSPIKEEYITFCEDILLALDILDTGVSYQSKKVEDFTIYEVNSLSDVEEYTLIFSIDEENCLKTLSYASSDYNFDYEIIEYKE